MHIVPAPAESLMKSRVLSIPGLQGVMDGLGMDTGFSDFRQGWVWTFRRAPIPHLHVIQKAVEDATFPEIRLNGCILLSERRGVGTACGMKVPQGSTFLSPLVDPSTDLHSRCAHHPPSTPRRDRNPWMGVGWCAHGSPSNQQPVAKSLHGC